MEDFKLNSTMLVYNFLNKNFSCIISTILNYNNKVVTVEIK